MNMTIRLISAFLLLSISFAHASDPWELSQDMQVVEDSASSKDLYVQFLRLSVEHLITTYRWPNPKEAERILWRAKDLTASEEEDEVEEVTVESLLASRTDLMGDAAQLFPNKFLYLQRKIASQFIRAVRQSDLAKRFRTVPTTPSDEHFFLAAIKGKTNGGPALLMEVVQGRLTHEHFLDLYVPGRESEARTGHFPQPLVFPDGVDGVERLARFDAPFAFHSYVDTRKMVTPERAEKTLAAMERSKGFIAVSWTSGRKIVPLWLKSLQAIAEKNDFVILIGATLNSWEGFPTELLDEPRIHLVTHDIGNDSLKISTEPINPDIEDPIPESRKPGRFEPNQNVLVFHPHLRLETVPTGSNDVAPVLLMSSGSLTEGESVYSSPSQGRRKVRAKAFNKLKAWVFEKSDGQASLDPEGNRNLWHPTPISYADDREFGGTAGTVFRGIGYEFDAKGELHIRRQDPLIWYLGDEHIPNTDPEVVAAMLRDLDLPSDTHVIFQSGDTFDFSSISHWYDDKKLDLNVRFQNGDVFLKKQVNAVIETINALLQRYPNARYRMIVGNHDEWLNRLLNRTPDYQAMINGDFIDELSFVVKNLGWNVWDYIFNRRQAFWESVLVNNPAQKQQILRRLRSVYAPERIDVVQRGEDLMVGPAHRKTDVGRHGDRASFGMKRPSLRAHALGMPEGGGVVGDSHRPGIFSEVYDVGTFSKINPDYGKGFNSPVGQAIAPVYRNGTKELFIYNRQARAFRPRDPTKVPLGSEFFGDDPLKIGVNDNEHVPKHEEFARIKDSIKCMEALLTK